MLERIGSAWAAFEPYLYQLLVGIVAVIALLKDWKDYGKLLKYGKIVPLGLTILTVVIVILSLADTHNSRREAREEKDAAQKRETISQTQITDLTTQVRQGREEKQKNSDGFRKSFSALYDRYSDLAAKVKNEDLLREVKKTREELVATQQKLNPTQGGTDREFLRPGDIQTSDAGGHAPKEWRFGVSGRNYHE